MDTLGVYSYVWRGVDYDLPFMEMIQSVMPIVDEVVIVTDPRVEDGTIEQLKSIDDGRLKVHVEQLDLDRPGVEGHAMALARNMLGADILLEMDADEALRPEDYPKIEFLKDNWPERCSIIAAGVINWFNGEHFNMSAPWVKPRISLNRECITHGIPKQYREPGPGKYYHAKPGGSDSAYITEDGISLSADEYQCNLDALPGDLYNKNSIYVHSYKWYCLPRQWEQKQTLHYFQGLLEGKYGCLADYTVNMDGELVDFWGPPRRKPGWSYIKPITDEMRSPDIVRVKRPQHPPVMQEWLSRQRVYVPGCRWTFRREVRRNIDPMPLWRTE